MRKIGIGIIGAGYMGQTHASAYTGESAAQVVAIADVDFPKAKKLAEIHKCRAFDNFQELLDLPEVDAVSICTPDALHKEPVLYASHAKKHILLEKPIASTWEDAQVIAQAVKKSGVLCQLGFVERFNQSYTVAQQAVQEGSVGNLITVRAQRMNVRYAVERIASRGDNVITFIAVHDLDLLTWFGGGISKLSAEGGVYTFPEYPETEDAALITVRFVGGAMGLVQVTWGLIDSMPFKATSKLEIVGDQGIINVDTLDDSVTIHSKRGFNNLIGWDRSAAFKSQIAHFLQCIKRQTKPRVGINEGLESLKLALAARQSIKTGQPIYFDD